MTITPSDAKRTRRGPNDGLPYYCNACGAGFAEFLACESLCELETMEKAAKRRVKWLAAMAAKRGTHYKKRGK